MGNSRPTRSQFPGQFGLRPATGEIAKGGVGSRPPSRNEQLALGASLHLAIKKPLVPSLPFPPRGHASAASIIPLIVWAAATGQTSKKSSWTRFAKRWSAVKPTWVLSLSSAGPQCVRHPARQPRRKGRAQNAHRGPKVDDQIGSGAGP
jgi:hypothetical protein